MKKILGLDLGTNSIGWALINLDFEEKKGSIEGIGSRIIPMDQKQLTDFEAGNTISQTAERTHYRAARRLYQRDNLRRERLHRVLNLMGFLPKHYRDKIDFENHLGQFTEEVKLNYRRNSEGHYEFLFKDSFHEMIREFEKNGFTAKVPYDWSIYYLRKKALTEKIKKEELAWILLNFNQKRGYYQLRNEDIEEETDNKEYVKLKVNRVVDSGELLKKTGEKLYKVYFENGWKYPKLITKPENWERKYKEFIVTTTINKNGEINRSFKTVNAEQDWIAIKKKTEQDIEHSGKQVGEYIFDTLLTQPSQKIRGKLIRTIERKFYKKELKAILETQANLHTELRNKELYQKCINELYPRNEAHRLNIRSRDFVYLFIEDIIFYQRPLKSKKSTISGCRFEKRKFKKILFDKITGEQKKILVEEPIKAIAKSNPYFQEFRLWQFLSNLKIYQKENEKGEPVDVDVTHSLLPTEKEWTDLFDFMNKRKEIEQKNIVQYFITKGLIHKSKKDTFRWNYVEDKKYPANETHAQFISRCKNAGIPNPENFLTNKTEYELWQIIYSIKDLEEYKKALSTFAQKNGLNAEAFVNSFLKFPPFKNDYGAYSEKAIKKLLPLMRMGKYWHKEAIDPKTKIRIEKFLTGEMDNEISLRAREKAIHLRDIADFKGLPLWLASYIVYNRYAEAGDIQHWETSGDIDKFLNTFKQHSLRNPIVEQVITETLRVVRDIWNIYGDGEESFFDEIHIELGRDLKNPADKRKKLMRKNIENENTNQRIRILLEELKNDGIPEVKPYSPSQQELLKIYEEGIYLNPDANFSKVTLNEIDKIRKSISPTRSEILRYKLWLEQGYISPYTGKPIPLSRLFSTDYQIEHIIPQSRYFDNSFSNKVICESEVNQLKDNQTAYEFIKNHGGEIVPLIKGKSVKILNLDDYKAHCSRFFKRDRAKLKKLLSEEIPEGFINRQLNDSRYISKVVKGLLSNIVREKNEQEATSKNIVPVTGSITSLLKKDWGLNDQWNSIIAPRFIRLNKLTNSSDFGFYDPDINAFRVRVPDDLLKGFSKKRIDHRHHALDALVIACCTKDHINYISSLNAKRTNFRLVSKLRKIEETEWKNPKNGKIIIRKVAADYKLPWMTFPVDAKTALEKTIVSFKQNIRVINKTKNKTWQWVEHNGRYKKQFVRQTKGDNWAVRKPLHKETYSGKVYIKENKTVSFNKALEKPELIVDSNIRILVERTGIDNLNERIEYFRKNPVKKNGKKITKLTVFTDATASRDSLGRIKNEKHIEKITDRSIKKILFRHIDNYRNEEGKINFDEAFSPEGIEQLNQNIVALNDGKFHQPVYKARFYEKSQKFRVGYRGNRQKKYVEAAKGTNLFFAIYRDEAGNRNFETVPLNEVIEHQKQTAHLPKSERTPVPVKPEKGVLLFTLSTFDLVYVPTDEEQDNPALVNFKNLTRTQVNRIYKMVSSSGYQCFFVKQEVAAPIIPKVEFSALNKMEKDINGIMIKDRCWKLKTDRLGNIVKVIR